MNVSAQFIIVVLIFKADFPVVTPYVNQCLVRNCNHIHKASKASPFYWKICEQIQECIKRSGHFQDCLFLCFSVTSYVSIQECVGILGSLWSLLHMHATSVQPGIHGEFIKSICGSLSFKLSLLSPLLVCHSACFLYPNWGCKLILTQIASELFSSTFGHSLSAFHAESTQPPFSAQLLVFMTCSILVESLT